MVICRVLILVLSLIFLCETGGLRYSVLFVPRVPFQILILLTES